jgi:hypothetical protein
VAGFSAMESRRLAQFEGLARVGCEHSSASSGDDDEAREAEASRMGPDEAHILGPAGVTARRRRTTIMFGLAFVVMTYRSEKRRSDAGRRGRRGA